ncbi:MAG: peptide chain release factor N(5)-glutamine methyltransferase [Ruminococcaceae bacterium]|nr:peptide chain release factor N(5)-glutamine methyltransferase [Oscillospiraceae bacterium]
MESMEERLLRQYFGNNAKRLEDARKRLLQNEPLAYILGETVFFDEYYYVTPDTLIPRPDTERVVEWVLKHLPKDGILLDLCCGSGCIGISALKHSVNTTALSVDISEGALSVAERNAARNGVSDRIRFVRADLTKEPFLADERFDVIVSNPPYVKSAVVDTLEKECSFEPRIAFDGGEDGMFFYRLILARFAEHLKQGGCFVFEIGYDQKMDMSDLAKAQGFDCQIYKDYGKNDRVAVLRPNRKEESYEIQ